MTELERLTNHDENHLGKLLKSLGKMKSQNLLNIFALVLNFIKETKYDELTNELLVVIFFKALQIDFEYKKAYKYDNYKGYNLEEIGKIVNYMSALRIKKTIRKQKVTDLLRLHRQLVVVNMNKMSLSELTDFINITTKNNISRGSVVNFVKLLRKENVHE